ncbi:unnamed protein product [Brassica oleracea]
MFVRSRSDAKHRISVCENNSDDNCISHQSQAQQQHGIVGVDLVDSEGDLVMAEGRDSVLSDLQENPAAAQKQMQNPMIMNKNPKAYQLRDRPDEIKPKRRFFFFYFCNSKPKSFVPGLNYFFSHQILF